ncbi:hypothetical protein LSCM1_07854 [Leishmania martiniquensis]|uniref:Uncharacterized protein n=1 Tax=Leishmania martiniquensis TaxID=1580590 RepID=A0A836H290_9TRYP|nr:hypothetical protein LSCM1_07854 [Leishmania martiniquensis]
MSPSCAMEAEGPLTGTPTAAAPVGPLPIASAFIAPPLACAPEAHSSAGAGHRRVVAPPICTAASFMQPTSCTLSPRQLRKPALRPTTMSIAPHPSQRNGSDSSEDFLAVHTALPPKLSPSPGAEARSLSNEYSSAYNASLPSCGAVSGGVEPQHRCMRPSPCLPQGVLTALAESRTATSPPSAPSHEGAAVVCEADEIFARAPAVAVPASMASLASTESSTRHAQASPFPPLPAAEPTLSPHDPLPGRGSEGNTSPGCRCSMNIPSSRRARSSFARRPSAPGRCVVAHGPAQGTGQGLVHRLRSASAPPHTVVHELLSTRRTAEPAMPVALPAALRLASYLSGPSMQGFLSPNEDGADSTKGSATTTSEAPLMLPDTRRVTVFSGTAAVTTRTTATATPHTSPSLPATQRRRSASVPVRDTCSFSRKTGGSVCACLAAVEAEPLPKRSESLPHGLYAPSSATASEVRSRWDEDSAEAPFTAATTATGSANLLLMAPAVSVRREDLAWFLSPFRDVDAQSYLAAAPLHLHASLVAECARAMRAVRRQEVWAQHTTAGREELQRQVVARIFAKRFNRAEGILEDAPTRRRCLAAPWPKQELLSDHTVLVSGDRMNRAQSAAAANIPPSQGFFLQRTRSPAAFTRCRRGTPELPEERAMENARLEAAGDVRAVAAVESCVAREATVGSVTVEASEWAQPQRWGSGIEARAAALLPPGLLRSRFSEDSSSCSLSYEAALLTAAQEMLR